MKLIGKQIVVELPKEMEQISNPPLHDYEDGEVEGFNDALSEVAKMNLAWEVDIEALSKEIQKYFGIIEVQPDDITKFDVAKTVEKVANWGMTNGLAQALASNPSAWMKRKDSDENK